ncbi:MAG: hypothetical protein WCE75_16600 [Terracidiphilus sp.]
MDPAAFMAACRRIVLLCFGLVFLVAALLAQSPRNEPASGPEAALNANPGSLLNLVRWNGVLPEAAGKAAEVRFAIYAEAAGGEPLWSETQEIHPGPDGHYSVLLGATAEEGLPRDLFPAGQPRWLETTLGAGGSEPAPRNLLAAVPYALKAADAALLGGRPAANFVTQEQLAGSLQATTAAAAVRPDASPSGAGTTGYLPLWTSASALGTSNLFQSGTGSTAKLGLGTASPGATLDVNGKTRMRGELDLLSGAATATSGAASPGLKLGASSYNSGTGPVPQNFLWQVLPAGNNTAAPSANLALLFGAGTIAPATTGLSIAPNGQITFAAGQKFPGTGPGTLTGVSAGTGLTGGGTSGNVTLKLDTTKIPQLGAFNTFASGASFGGESWWNGNSGDWMMVVTNTATAAKGVLLGQAQGSVTGIEGASPAGEAVVGLTTTGTAITGQAYGEGGAAYFWSQAAKTPAVLIHADGSTNDGLDIVAHGGNGLSSTSGNGYGGLFANNSTFQATVYASNTGPGNAGFFTNSSPSHAALAGVDQANTASAIGVYGQASSGIGVDAISSTGPALSATSGTGWAGNFTNSAVYAATVNATNNGGGNAGYFANNSAGRVALAGVNASTDPGAVGAYGSTSNGYGVYGTSGGSAGVYGISTGTGPGVLGKAQAGVGLFGSSQEGAGVWGELGFPTGESGQVNAKAGIWGDAGDATTYTPIGVIGTADSGGGGFFANNSKAYYTLGAYNASGGPTHNLAGVFVAASPLGACGVGSGGDLSCTGQVKALVTTKSSRQVETYSVQSAENWLEDYGSGQLVNGRAVVQIDPAFVDAVNTGVEFHVFLTPNGDCKGLFVDHKSASSFEVHELGGGRARIGFDYKIVARRTGHEAERLVDVTEKLSRELETVRRMHAAVAKPVPRPAVALPGVAAGAKE